MPRIRKHYGIGELSDLLREISVRLKELREQAGISQSELARRAGIGKSTLNEIENRVACDVQFSTLCQVAKALKVKVTELFPGSDLRFAPSDTKEFIRCVEDMEKCYRHMERLKHKLR